MKTQSKGSKPTKVQLGGIFTQDLEGLAEFTKVVNRMTFSRKRVERLNREKFVQAKQFEAMVMTTNFFNGQETNFGFKKPLEARITANGGSI